MSVRDYFSRDIRLRHLRLLVAIDDAGRLARVARMLNVTQPALSKVLAEIERSIGEPLFERTPQGLVANRAGAALVRAARGALAELERASAELLGDQRADARTLLVGAMPTSPLAFLGRAIERLGRRMPDVNVRVVDGQTGQLLSQLVAGRLHLVAGARVRATIPDGIQAIDLFEDPLQLVAGPGHPLLRRRAPTWDECIAHPWVLPPPGNPTRAAFDRALRAHRLAPPQRIVEALSTDVVVAMLAEGGALNLMPRRLAAALRERGLARVVGGGHAQRLDLRYAIAAFVNAERRDDDAVRAMIECLGEVAAPG